MASLERYGLATTEQLNPAHFRIAVSAGAPEQALKFSRKLLAQEPESPPNTRKLKHWKKLHARMRRYVQSTDGWFIRYDNDWQIVEAYREKARLLGQGYLEAEAFPNDVIIGDRTFGAWKEACNQAVGRILAHMDFAAFLHRKNPTVTLDNVLTIFAKRDDVEAIWREAGLPSIQVMPTMHALTLEYDDLYDWERAFEVPTVFYIGLGKHFVLLPCFGALINPYFALFRHLREFYRSDWDRAVDQREAIFRADLATVFPPARFTIPEHGLQLRRPNGSVITDIDALILDNKTGDLALIQLKWHDIFGFSLRERESRRRNIAKANEWVERVSEWVSGRSSKELLSALGIKARASSRPPLLYIIARYGARFTGDHTHDARAHWMGWPEVKSASKFVTADDDSPLFQIPSWVQMCQKKIEKYEIKNWDFKFPNLRIQLELPINPDTAQ